MSSIIVGILLVISLFIFFTLTIFINKKTKKPENFEIKGFIGSCQSCEQTTCPIHPGDKKEEN